MTADGHVGHQNAMDSRIAKECCCFWQEHDELSLVTLSFRLTAGGQLLTASSHVFAVSGWLLPTASSCLVHPPLLYLLLCQPL
mmetsp:Transcript_111014/g.220834  ORF Transcript_111014/g.220834 Transcript_111014/m.220834 type:complete len:83 (-) Transcript_111014:70-318(-)